ncbi:MAG: hypothetical protein JRE43_01000, partial [Deltaproteobacteria bacterium]|nr:hypothetical protein [Deltaproteobacteria bacterium]
MQAKRVHSDEIRYRVAAAAPALTALFALLASIAMPLAGARAACAPIELLYDENENIHEKRVDHNKDCTYDEIVYYGEKIRSKVGEMITDYALGDEGRRSELFEEMCRGLLIFAEDLDETIEQVERLSMAVA